MVVLYKINIQSDKSTEHRLINGYAVCCGTANGKGSPNCSRGLGDGSGDGWGYASGDGVGDGAGRGSGVGNDRGIGYDSRFVL